MINHSEEISTLIKQKGAGKKFELILTQIKDIKPDDNSKKSELKTQLEKLIENDDHFIQEYFKNHRAEIENALSQLTTQKKKQNSPNKDNNTGLSTKQKVGLGVVIVGGVLFIIGLVILVRRRKSPQH
ncbi:MAG: hypothetical protein I3273_05765 [Candidatus Moeniiplasma glomeromycotorum]|nr:hypothetical protein [Candidatus Moeniiplasma glomeromycotorum]MCE8169592.1 hypothetical protein [Candidatus Moeniiplasma glomeromycotorum]